MENKNQTLGKEYYYGLDLLRSMMMLYGVIWHTGCWIWWKEWGFLETKIHQSKDIFAVVSIPHIFRMETFFLVAGFLSCMVLSRKDKKQFFQARIKRVLFPLIFGCFCVNLLIVFYFKHIDVFYGNFKLWNLFEHGWFLVCLFVFVIIDTFLNKTKFYSKEYIIIPLAFIASVEVYQIWKLYHSFAGSQVYQTWKYYNQFQSINFFGDLTSLFIEKPLIYFIYYYLGSRLYIRRDCLKNINNKDIWYFTILAIIFVFCASRLDNHYWHFASQPRTFIVIAGILMSLALFLIFYKIINKPNGKITNYLIDSSIVIYILHQPVVMLFGYYFDHLPINNITFFIMVCVFTFIFSFLLYEIIKRFKILKLMFGLK